MNVGDTFTSPSKTLTDAHFLFFSGLTGDAHPLHYDVEYAKTTRFGRPLAHGLMLTSMTAVGASTLSPLIEDSIVAFLEQTTRFRAPVFVGDTLWAETEVTEVRESRSRPTHGIVSVRTRGVNQRREVVVEFARSFLVPKRDARVETFPGTDDGWRV